MKTNEPKKFEWHGTIVSVQPRTTVWRYRLDNRTHYHRGYNIFLDGEVSGIKKRFSVAISEKQQQKFIFRIGDEVKGTAWTKMYDVSDFADYYRAGSLKKIKSPTANKTANEAAPLVDSPVSCVTIPTKTGPIIAENFPKIL